MDVITSMDTNLDTNAWDNNFKGASYWTLRLKPLFESLYTKIIPRGVAILNNTVTHQNYGAATKSCIDHIFTTHPHLCSNTETIWKGLSDHAMIKTIRNSKMITNQPKYSSTRKWSNITPELLAQHITNNTHLNTITDQQNPNIIARTLIGELTGIINTLAPKKNI